MKIAIIGAGQAGLAAAQVLGEDPRHVVAVFEAGARPGGPFAHLARLGVTLRTDARVERLSVDEVGVDLWVDGTAERVELVLVATSRADALVPLRSPLRNRVYVAERGDAAWSALVRMAADHPTVRAGFVADPPRVGHTLRTLARRAGGVTATHVSYLDLSGVAWPLRAPAVYVADQPWLLDIVQRHLTACRPLMPTRYGRHFTTTTTVAALEAGTSLAFAVEGDLPARAAAIVALETNAAIVPIAGHDRPSASRFRQARVRVVVGEPFYPETSSVDELLGDMRAVIRHLGRLARDRARQHAG